MNVRKRKYRIADLNVSMTTQYDRTYNQADKYATDDAEWEYGEEDADIYIEESYLKKKQEGSFRGTPLEQIEYMCTGSVFYRYLMGHDGVLLHSSAVVVDGYAYLFSANSGTGKSTHTGLWKEYFGDRAFIINDDKPAVRKVDGEWYVYGTPWSGKTDLNVNTRAKLGAIVFLERSENNWIEEMTPADAVSRFIGQTTRKLNKLENMERLLTNIDTLLTEVPLYKMGCNISFEAVKVAYEKIVRKDGENED